jgi:signal transduction histidine kinase
MIVKLTGTTLNRAGIGALFALAALAASVLSGDVLGHSAPGHPLLLLAILAASWYGELLGGLVATAICILGYWLYLVPPKWSLGLSEWESFYLLSFAITAMFINAFNYWRRRTEAALERASFRLRAARERTAGLLKDARHARLESESTNDRLSKAIHVKDEFLGLMSHELRTPTTTLYGGTKVLRHERLSDADRDALLEVMEKDAERLKRMIEDLLTLARINAGEQKQVGPVLLQRVVPEFVKDFKGRTKRSGPVIVVAEPDLPPADATDGCLERVLDNLLNNADKYSPSSEPIAVFLKRNEGEIIVSVRDRGPGVAQNELTAIFEQFYRSGRTATSAGGTGLGLTVCRRLIESNGGRIWPELPPEGGLQVSFALPIAPEFLEEPVGFLVRIREPLRRGIR